MTGRVLQIEICPDPIKDEDFIVWWDGIAPRHLARTMFLTYIRLGIREGEIPKEFFDALARPDPPSGKGRKRRGRRRKDEASRKRQEIRLALNRVSHSDIVEEWEALPVKSKGPTFILYWRVTHQKYGTIPMSAFKNVSAPRAPRMIVEEIIAVPVQEEVHDAHPGLMEELEEIAKIHLAHQNNTSDPGTSTTGGHGT